MLKYATLILALAFAVGCSGDDSSEEKKTDQLGQSQDEAGGGGEAEEGAGGEAGEVGDNIPDEKVTYDEATGECHNARRDCETLDKFHCQEARACQDVHATNAEGEVKTACLSRCTPNVGLLEPSFLFVCFEIDGGYYATSTTYSQSPKGWREAERSNCAFADPLLCEGFTQDCPN